MGRPMPGRLPDVVRDVGTGARGAGRDARIGLDQPLAVGVEVLRVQPVLLGHRACELGVELREQRRVVAQLVHVVSEVVETRGVVEVFVLLQRAFRIGNIGGRSLVYALYHRGHLLQLLADRHGNGPAVVVRGFVLLVKFVETAADALQVVSRPVFGEEVGENQVVRVSVGHHLAGRGDQVVGDVPQVVCRLDRRHEAVVEENVVEMKACGGNRFRKGRGVGAAGAAVPEPAGELPVGRDVFPMPLFGGRKLLAAAEQRGACTPRRRDPRHAVRADHHAVPLGGGRLRKLGEELFDYPGLCDVEVFVGV